MDKKPQAEPVAGDDGLTQELISLLRSALSRFEARLSEGPPIGPDHDRPSQRDLLEAIIKHRRRRAHFLPKEMFGEPAWDMLLDLALARITGKHVSISSLCIASAVPPTTALRWISTMVERGILVRRADPADGRRVYVELSEETADAMSAWIGSLMP